MRSSATTATGVFPPRDHHLPALGTAGAPQDRRHNEQGGAQQQQSVPNNGKFGFHDENVVEGLRAELRQYREDTRGMLRQKDEALEQLMGRMDRKDEALERMRKEHREEMNKKDEALQKLMDKKDEALERLRRESLETHEKLRQEHREDLNRLLQAGQVMPATQNQQHQPSSWPQRVESSVERLAQQPAMPSTSSAAAPSPHQRRVKQAALTTQRRSSHTPSLATVSAAAFVTQLKDGGDGAEATLVDALEVGLEVLEALATSLPRKQRKAIKELCRRVEAKLEQVDEDLLGRLAAYEAADLARLGESLAAVQALQAAADIGVECVGVVAGTLDELGRIGDVVTGARQQLVSNETNMRMRGIDALRNLPRVLLPEPAAAEVAAASLVETMLVDEGKTDGERAGAGWALFALGLRNGAAAVDVLEKSLEGIWLKVHFEACDGRLQGREGAAVVVVAHGCNFLAGTMGELYPVVRARIETALLTCVSQFVANAAISKSRYQELLSHLIEATTAEDIAEASAAVKVLDPFMFLKSGPECIGAFLKSDPVRVWWEVRRRVVEPGAPAARWREIAQTLSMDTVCLALLQQLINETAAFFMAAIPHDGLWPKIIAEHVHLANVNWEAKISAQDRGSNFAFKFTNIVEKAAQDPAHHPALMPCAEALLWLTANSCPFIGQDIADEAAAACVSLLGKNEKEGGLTLDKNAIDRVLLVVHRYFDTSPNADLWTLQAAREKDGNKVAAKIQLIVDMVIADASKYSRTCVLLLAVVSFVLPFLPFLRAHDASVSVAIRQTSFWSSSTRTCWMIWWRRFSSTKPTSDAAMLAPRLCRQRRHRHWRTWR
eukprot:COSAG05_NODE_7_length_42457_cov_58.929152_48_plen_836_part_00